PSSYRDYAVDFDGDGKANLWTSAADAIGSIANYYQAYGWQENEPVMVEATVSGDEFTPLLSRDIQPHTPVAELQNIGVTPEEDVPGENLASLLALIEGDETRYWLAFNNFYVITSYNRSVYYAMAVYELSREILSARGERIPDINN
ncbi:MAG: lytic murein transglycosylase, partial [Burkholderiales bacterium]